MHKGKGAFLLHLEKQRIVAYARLSSKEKLEWLCAASEFCKKAVRGRARESWLSSRRRPF